VAAAVSFSAAPVAGCWDAALGAEEIFAAEGLTEALFDNVYEFKPGGIRASPGTAIR
jgi:hypothetical protein